MCKQKEADADKTRSHIDQEHIPSPKDSPNLSGCTDQHPQANSNQQGGSPTIELSKHALP